MSTVKQIHLDEYKLLVVYKFKTIEMRVFHYDMFGVNENDRRTVYDDVYTVEKRVRYFHVDWLCTGWVAKWSRDFTGFRGFNKLVHRTKEDASRQLADIAEAVKIHMPLERSGKYSVL